MQLYAPNVSALYLKTSVNTLGMMLLGKIYTKFSYMPTYTKPII